MCNWKGEKKEVANFSQKLYFLFLGISFWFAQRYYFLNCPLSSQILPYCSEVVIPSRVKYFPEEKMIANIGILDCKVMKKLLIIGCQGLVVGSHLETVTLAVVLGDLLKERV